jgi:poly-gamma-glutamate capsule biosynthesis protein CapA/YwtB (metallophosphatase superfamily)
MKFRLTLLIWLAAMGAACSPAAAVNLRATVTPAPAETALPQLVPSVTRLPTRPPAAPTPTRSLVSVPTLPASPSPVSPTPQAPTLRLLFTGDISPGRCVYHFALAAGDMALPYRPLASLLQGADITIGSLDATLSDYNPPVPCIETRNLMAPAASVQGLQFAGFDVMTVATNHAKDCGVERGCRDQSLFDTLANLTRAGIVPVGAGSTLTEALTPAILTVQGVRFAFLGFSAVSSDLWATAATPGTAPFKKELYLAAIRQAREKADVVIVLPHWGAEYFSGINWEQYYGAASMIEAGATLVVGNHPHRAQGREIFPNGAVAVYALGNFIFDQDWSDKTQYVQEGLLLAATFSGARLQSTELIPIHIYDDFQPRLAPVEEGREILRQAAEALAPLPPRPPELKAPGG